MLSSTPAAPFVGARWLALVIAALRLRICTLKDLKIRRDIAEIVTWPAIDKRHNKSDLVLSALLNPGEGLSNRVHLIIMSDIWEAKEFGLESVKPGRALWKKHRPGFELCRDLGDARLLVALWVDTNDRHIARSQVLDQARSRTLVLY